MFDVDIYAASLFVGLVIGLITWLISLVKRDVSIVDPLWALFFLAMTLTYLVLAPALEERAYLVLFVVTVWAVRLSLFVLLRNLGKPKDRRCRPIRFANQPRFWLTSLYLVFGLQAILAWIISLPLLASILGAAPLNWIDLLAVALWLTGFGFEAIGDQQLAAFKADPSNRGKVMNQGLWRYTRHPNYFGEACIWWAYYLFAVATGGWWTLLSPVLITFLLLRVSGIAMLEKDIGKRRPAYRDYSQTTNAFFPGPPKPPGVGH